MRSNHPWLYMQLLVSTVCGIYGIRIVGSQEKLLFSTEFNLKEIDLNTGVVNELSNHSTNVHSLTYDVKERLVCVPRYEEHVIDRFPYPNDQNVNLETFVSTNDPFYVAFDSENSHLYWTKYNSPWGRIIRSDSDGSSLTTIINAIYPIALALDTHNRWIYYSAMRKINKVKFDGTEKQVVLNLTDHATGLRLDMVDKRIYWMGWLTGDLKSSWYNGSDVKTVVSTNKHSYNREIDIRGDYIFYTSHNEILKIHKSSGQSSSVVHTDTSQIYGLLFYTQEVTDKDY